MVITVNGKKVEIGGDITLKELIDNLKISDRVMAAAVNMEIVKKQNWDKYHLKDRDKIELLHFVGGG